MVLLWLLAWVVPLQCSAALMRMAAGPAHGHAVASLAAPASELRDFRRQPLPDRQAQHAAAAAHHHGPGARHHHAGDDATVVASERALDRLDSQDENAGGGALGLLIPLVPSAVSWQAPGATHAAPGGPAWWAASRPAAPLERPPRDVPA